MHNALGSTLRVERGGPRRVLYIAGVLPTLSETFVWRELLALRDRGLAVDVASVNQPVRDLGDARLAALAAEAIVVYGTGPIGVLAGSAVECVTHPVRAAGTIARAITDVISGSDVPLSRVHKVLYQALASLALARRVRRRGITHIHAHMAHVPTTIAMYTARQLGVPFSFTGHANDLFPQRTLLREKLRRAAFVACISHWHRRLYASIAPVGSEHLPVIRCGVEIPAAGRRPRTPELRIVSVGRLIPKKGFDVLVRALRDVVDAGVEVRCEIIGGGPEDESLRRLVTELGLTRQIELAGPMPNADALARVEGADLFVLPCRLANDGDRDGIPVSLMEAMARGVCVISGDLEPIRELVEDGATGVMVAPGEVAPLAKAIVRLALDPARRLAIADAGRARVIEEFSLDVNIARLQAALGTVPASATSTPQEAQSACAV